MNDYRFVGFWVDNRSKEERCEVTNRLFYIFVKSNKIIAWLYNIFRMIWLTLAKFRQVDLDLRKYRYLKALLSYLRSKMTSKMLRAEIPLTTFWFLTSFFKIRKRFFASSIKIISDIFAQNFLFLDERRVISVAPQRGVVPPPINPDVFFFRHIGHDK